MRKTFLYLNHQDKGRAYRQALLEGGWREVTSERECTICIADSDVTPMRVERLDHLQDFGAKVFLYQHSARPSFLYDFPGFAPPHPVVAARFVTAPNHKKFMEYMGLGEHTHVVGWSFCPILPFVPIATPWKILFAPLHPAGNNGWLSEDDKTMNQEVQKRLYSYTRQKNIELTIRYVFSFGGYGLERLEGVKYVEGKPDQSFKEIDEADLVVGTETFAYLAVARGKPTLMMDEDRAPRYGNSPERFGYVSHWDDYKHLVMYDLDILASENTEELVRKACTESRETWKSGMVGKAFDGERFVKTVAGYL